MLTLNEAKEHLRILDNDDDVQIQSLVVAADVYIKNASHSNVDTISELYKLACKMLVAHWYFNKEITGKADKLAHSLDAILFQLKYTTEDAL